MLSVKITNIRDFRGNLAKLIDVTNLFSLHSKSTAPALNGKTHDNEW